MRELLYAVSLLLDEIAQDPVIYEPEYVPSEIPDLPQEAYSVSYDKKQDEYVVEGPLIDKMLGYTNIESEKGFAFFQNFIKENGVLDRLKAIGMKDGDTVRMYGHVFEYYPGTDEETGEGSHEFDE